MDLYLKDEVSNIMTKVSMESYLIFFHFYTFGKTYWTLIQTSRMYICELQQILIMLRNVEKGEIYLYVSKLRVLT